MTLADAGWAARVHGLSFPAGEAWNEAAFHDLLSLPGVFGYGFGRSALLLARSVLDECEILTIAVTPNSRRQGLARRLLARLIEDTAAVAVTRIFLEVAPGNTAAVALYRSYDFAPMGSRPDYYGAGQPALRMGRVPGIGPG